MTPKELLKQTAARYGYQFVKAIDHHGDTANVLDLAVRAHVARHGKPFILQVGANDGLRDDPIRAFIAEHHLAGLLVEPIPALFAELQRNYRDFPDVTVENCAIADRDGTRDLYRVTGAAAVPDWALGIAGFDRAVLLKHRGQFPDIARYVETLSVATLSVPTLLARHGVTDVGLLQVDTEGYDFEIIKMCLGAGLRPRIINYEYVHLGVRQQEDCRCLLGGLGYRFLNVSKDTLALRDL